MFSQLGGGASLKDDVIEHAELKIEPFSNMTWNGLEFDCEVFSLAFHPRENLIASGLVSGAIHL